MGRLHAILLMSPDVEAQRAWYGAQLGLSADESPHTFATRGAALELHAHAAPAIELVIAVRGLAARVAAIRGRGGSVDHAEGAAEARIADPDGTAIRLVEDAGARSGRWPHLSHVIVNCSDLSRSGHFYRDALGLKVADDTGVFLELESGDCRLLLHDETDQLGVALHSEQRVAFVLSDEDLDRWADELRGRDVTFATAPMEEELGRLAEVEDADGWFVVLRGPGAPLPREEELAAEYDDEESLHSGGARRSLDPAEMNQRPAFGSRKLVKRRIERVTTKGFEQLQRADDSRGGERPPLPRTGPGAGARPGFSGPRPGPPGFSGPRPGPPGSSGPRPGPSGPRSGPPGPRIDRPGVSGPRPGFSGPRPGSSSHRPPGTPPSARPPHAGPPSARPGPPRPPAPRRKPDPDGE